MPRYLISGFLCEIPHLLPAFSDEDIVLRFGPRGDDGASFYSSPGRLGPSGTCIWDEEFSVWLDFAAECFQEAVLRFEVLCQRGGWRETKECLAAGSLRLSWIHALPGHAHPRLRIPLKRAPLAPLELRLGLCVLAPGDAAPHPCWMTERVTMPWVSATRPKAPEGVATRKVTALPLRSRLDFTMVSLWDLSLPQELSADDLLLDLSFRAEVATGEVDELVLLDTDVSEASNWRETFPAREGKACIQLPRTYTGTVELPGIFWAHQPAWLLVQVCLRQRSSSQVYFEGEACLPLMECWPPLGRFSLTGEDIREPGTELEEGCPGRFGKVPLFRAFSRMNTIQQVYDYLCTRLRIRNEDVRLWSMEDESKLRLLEEDNTSLEKLEIRDNHAVLIEVRNRDMSWPEEMSSLANNRSLREKLNLEPTEKGATGLSNLGNTCFMNSALQCLSNTQPLTQYFTNKCHFYELNRTNPLGMKGHIARRYGDLTQDLWSGSSRSLAPLKLRWTIGRYAPRFNGFQQHDSQEFLSFLLDGLHEDLNRVHLKPYVELKDSDGRPDEEVAHEAWDNHLKRNQSVVVDLFQGQLKSQVRCLECGYVSVRFDPFTFLSLPLPMDNSIYVEVIVVHLEGTTPTKYGLLLNNDDRYKDVKRELSKYSGLVSSQLLLVEIFGASVKSLPSDMQKIRTALAGLLYAYEIPLPTITCEDECSSSTTPGAEEKKEIICSECPAESANQISTNQTTNNQTLAPCSINVPNSEESEVKENKFSGTNSENCSEESDSKLKVQENWFGEAKKNKKRVLSSPVKRLSPKLRKKISPKFSGGFSLSGTLRKSSSSSSSMELTEGTYVSNSDSGISLCAENSPKSRTVSVPGNTDPRSGNSNSSTPLGGPASYLGYCFSGFVVAMHRKTIRLDAYFLSPQKNRPGLFGIPVIVPCTSRTRQCDLYKGVWVQVARLLSPPAPGETNCKNGDLGDYPFELRAVQKDGLTCAWCPWYRFCHGCLIKCSELEFGCSSSYIAIEWEPTTLHLRYQSSQEKVSTEHESVERSRKMQTEPIDLYECLRAFTKEEELGEEELWYCNKCNKHRLAVKKLDIWSLPPILVIHLKRFQFVNGHWVKSNKIVKFPMEGFDPSAFLTKPSTNRMVTESGVTTVTVRSREEQATEEEIGEKKEANSGHESEVNCSN